MIDKDTEQKILAEYDANAHTYTILAPKLEQLIRDILHEREMQVHTISSRPKSRKSLVGKLAKDNAKYEKLADLTDLVGLRITTYFAEDVDRVAAIIAEEFDIDLENSVDKRQSLASDRFGYLSLHHVMSLKDSRCELTEYKSFKGLKLELQTRSILQHAWAEIEHDLGYKSEVEVPQHIRRRFALVAGLLEVADRDFDSIKKDLEAYREKVSIGVEETPEDIMLDLDSIKALIEENATIKLVDNELIKSLGVEFLDKQIYASSHLENLQGIGFKTIGEVVTALQVNTRLVIDFAKDWVDYGVHNSLSSGISLFYLWYVLLSERPEEEILRLITAGSYGSPVNTTRELLDTIVRVKQNRAMR